MSIVVFAGPSADEAAIRAHAAPAEVRVLPPVKRGDIDRLFAAEDPPSRVGIVDGEFLQGLSISPKEILRAMDSHAAPVFYGSSSMGALRAAELADYGMIGVGRIAELYRSGRVDADDEVAVTFDPDTRAALCEPLVNIRLALADALEAGRIAQDTHDAALEAAAALYFPERAYPRLLAELGGALPAAELQALRDYLDTERPDAKRSDALALVSAITRADGAAAG